MKYSKRPVGKFYDKKKNRVIEHCSNGGNRIFWNPDMISMLVHEFPTSLNGELCGILGVSQRTMIRKARELNLQKNPIWLAGIWNERRKIAHAISKKKGYPGTFKKGTRIGEKFWFRKKELI